MRTFGKFRAAVFGLAFLLAHSLIAQAQGPPSVWLERVDGAQDAVTSDVEAGAGVTAVNDEDDSCFVDPPIDQSSSFAKSFAACDANVRGASADIIVGTNVASALPAQKGDRLATICTNTAFSCFMSMVGVPAPGGPGGLGRSASVGYTFNSDVLTTNRAVGVVQGGQPVNDDDGIYTIEIHNHLIALPPDEGEGFCEEFHKQGIQVSAGTLECNVTAMWNQDTRLFHVTGQEIIEEEKRNPNGTVNRQILPINYFTPAVNEFSVSRVVAYKNHQFDVRCSTDSMSTRSVGGILFMCNQYDTLFSASSSCDVFANNILLTGDLNGNGQVNLLDIQPFLNALNSGSYNPCADINDDGILNLLDLGPFLQLINLNVYCPMAPNGGRRNP